MADTRASVLGTSLTPDRVARAEFSSSFRGFDQSEVRSFLARLAADMRTLVEREEYLTSRVAELENRPEPEPPAPAELDDAQLTERLGQEAVRVLDAARVAAQELRARAQAEADERLAAAAAEADRITGAAQAEAGDVLARADQVLSVRSGEADAAAAAILAAAHADAERVRAEAVRERNHARTEAAAEIDAARADGRRMIAEARAVRERILTDMARRRNVGRQQVERLRAARERLLESVDGVRRSVDQITADLNGSLVDAKLAGDRAARAVDVHFVPALHELEAEVETAKDTGLIDAAAIEGQLGALATGEQPAVALDDDELDAVLEGAGSPDGSLLDPVGLGDRPVEEDQFVEDGDHFGEDDDHFGEDDDAELVAVEALLDDPDPDPDPARDGEATADLVSVTEAAPDGETEADIIDLRDLPETRVQLTSALDDVFARLRSTPSDDLVPGSDAVPPAPAPTPAKPKRGKGRRHAVETANGRTSGAVLVRDDAAEEVGDPAEDAADPASSVTGDQVAVQSRDAVLAGVVRDVARQLKLFLSDEQNRVLELVDGRGSAKTQPGDLPDLAAGREALATLARNELAAAVAAGWTAASPGKPPRSVDVADLAAEVAASLADPVRERIVAGFEDRESLPEVVRAAYRDARNQRLPELAQYAGLVAYAAGQLAAFKADGGAVRWVFDSCSPDCLDNSLAAAVRAGEPFPTGHLHPPAFVGCRCALLPESAAKSN